MSCYILNIINYLYNFIISAEIRVVTTNYNYAIIYECHVINKDGTCSSDAIFVDVLSRTLDDLPDIIRHQYYVLTKELCLTDTEMTDIQHDGR